MSFSKNLSYCEQNFHLGKKKLARASHSMKCRQFLDISLVYKILSVRWFGNLWGNYYIPCLSVIIPHHFTSRKRKICWNIKKSQNNMKMIVCKTFFSFLFFLLRVKHVIKCDILAGIFFILLKNLIKKTWNFFNSKFKTPRRDRRGSYQGKGNFKISFVISLLEF